MTDLFFVGSVNTQVGTIALLGDLGPRHVFTMEVEVFETSIRWTVDLSLLARFKTIIYNKYRLIRKLKHVIISKSRAVTKEIWCCFRECLLKYKDVCTCSFWRQMATVSRKTNVQAAFIVFSTNVLNFYGCICEHYL